MGKKRQNLKFFLLWLLPKCLDAVFHKTLFKLRIPQKGNVRYNIFSRQ